MELGTGIWLKLGGKTESSTGFRPVPSLSLCYRTHFLLTIALTFRCLLVFKLVAELRSFLRSQLRAGMVLITPSSIGLPTCPLGHSRSTGTQSPLRHSERHRDPCLGQCPDQNPPRNSLGTGIQNPPTIFAGLTRPTSKLLVLQSGELGHWGKPGG